MNDSERALLYATDKHVGALAQTMKQLAFNQAEGNSKLSDILSVVSAQSVMAEKFENLEVNLKESFGRYGGRLDVIEQAQNVRGCPSLSRYNTMLDSQALTINTLSQHVKAVESKTEDMMKVSTIKWMAIFLFGYITSFATYLVNENHRLDNMHEVYVATQRGINTAQQVSNRDSENADGEIATALDGIINNQNKNWETLRAILERGK